MYFNTEILTIDKEEWPSGFGAHSSPATDYFFFFRMFFRLFSTERSAPIFERSKFSKSILDLVDAVGRVRSFFDFRCRFITNWQKPGEKRDNLR